jgi:hypothetical protein
MDVLALLKDYSTPAVLLAVLGFVGHEVWGGYQTHKKDVYAKLDLKRDKAECKERMDTHLKESHHD